MLKEKSDEILILTSTKYIKQKEYWLNQLSGDFIGTRISLAGKTSSHTGKAVEAIAMEFPAQLCSQLVHLSYGNALTIYVILLAGLKALIYHYTGNKDVTVVSPTYTPQTPGNMMNDFLFIRDAVNGAMSFKDLLLEVKETLLKAYENQDYPYGKLIEYMVNNSLRSSEFISDIVCLLRNIHDDSHLKKLNTGLIFSLIYEEDLIKGHLLYDPGIYPGDFAGQVASHYMNLLEIVSGDVNVTISHICFLSKEEKSRLLFAFNNNRADFSHDQTSHCLVEKFSETTPDRVAVAFEGKQLTYRQLNQRSNRLARDLQNSGVREDHTVGILLNRSTPMVESILAAWKAGGAYIPLDPEDPHSRVSSILHDSSTGVLISQSEWVHPELKNAYEGIIINLETLKFNEAAEAGTANPELKTNMNALAYVIYTSGSTGKPKGAMVEHMGMMNHIGAKINELQLSRKSVVAQNASHTFDISVWQFFAALAVGGKTVIYPDELVLEPQQFINRLIQHRVNVLEVVPSYLSVLLEYFSPLPLDFLLVTGEVIKPNLVKQWFDKSPGTRMINAYGPTEVSDDITHYVMDTAPDWERIPIGKPIQNLNIYIVDENMNLCPPGIKGEICVSGVGVGRGYLNNPGLTAEKFDHDLWDDRDDRDENRSYKSHKSYIFKKLYKTGDIGCWLPNGTIEFLGRKDHQVKIRGFRIELGEIESQILTRGNIKEAVVIDKEDEEGNKYLCAYLVMENNKKEMELPAIKEHLSRQLPGYMVPAHFVELDRLPLTSNGKIDRKALPEPVIVTETISYVSKKMLKELQELQEKKSPLFSKEYLLENRADMVTGLEHQRRIIRDYSKQQGKSYYPLSYSQKMIYNTEKVFPNTCSEITGGTVRYQEELDRELLEQAINTVIYKNEGLRLRIIEIEHESGMVPAQYVSPYKKYPLDYIDFSDSEPGKNTEENLKKWVETNTRKPFQIIDNNLFYFAFLRYNKKETGYYIKLHHLVTDGWTFSFLLTEINKIYQELEASKSVPDNPAPSYLQYIHDEQEYLQSPRAIVDREYWYQTIFPLPAPWTLADKTGDSFHLDIESRTMKLSFPENLSIKMHQYCQKNNCTLYKLILSAVSLYISRVTSCDDFIIGTVSHGRSEKIYKKMAGIFINFITLRMNIDETMDFNTFVSKEITVKLFRGLKHQKFPFDILATELIERTGADIRRLFDINIVDHPAVNIQRFQNERYFPGYEPTPLSIHINPSKNITSDLLELAWIYQVKSFTDSCIRKIHQGIINILTRALDDPTKKLSTIELQPGGEGTVTSFDEIESRLLTHKDIKKTVLVVREDSTRGRYLCVYIVGKKRLTEAELKEYLAKELPDEMPSLYFIQMEDIPLKSSGKVDRKLLEAIDPDINKEKPHAPMAPRNRVEEKLVKIWSEVLGIPHENIGIDADFFQLGGHSLKATILISKLNKAFNVKVPLAEIFRTSTIRELASYVQGLTEEKFLSIQLVEKKEYYELSSAQKRLYIIQEMELESTSYNVTMLYTLEGNLEQKKIAETLKKLIYRHESLRTSVKIVNEEPAQEILQPDEVEFEIGYYKLDEEAHRRKGKEEEIIRDFIRPFDLSRAPLLRLGLMELLPEPAALHVHPSPEGKKQKYVLMLDMHHIITDGTSMAILVKDFIALYSGHRLPHLRLQYKDFSGWQNQHLTTGKLNQQEDYWLNKFKGDIPRLNINMLMDYPYPPGNDKNMQGAKIPFKLGKELTEKVRNLVLETGTTLYILLLTVYIVLLSKYTDQEDIIVGTSIAGRPHVDLGNIIGMFVNMLPMRNQPQECKTFKEFLEEVKKNTLEAYENQDYQFDQLVMKLDIERDNRRNPIFDTQFTFQNMEMEAGGIPDLDFKPYPYKNRKIQFDLSLNGIEVGETIIIIFEYLVSLFKPITIEKMTKHFIEILKQAAANKHTPLKDITVSHDLVGAKSGLSKKDSMAFQF
ncbi:MAG: amino acid adenylation domain-containing protein [Candidatus Aminicenantes bacterium]|jgi:amino acid adenylation domain-containing protein